jgi:hypothetical protein
VHSYSASAPQGKPFRASGTGRSPWLETGKVFGVASRLRTGKSEISSPCWPNRNLLPNSAAQTRHESHKILITNAFIDFATFDFCFIRAPMHLWVWVGLVRPARCNPCRQAGSEYLAHARGRDLAASQIASHRQLGAPKHDGSKSGLRRAAAKGQMRPAPSPGTRNTTAHRQSGAKPPATESFAQPRPI